MRTLRKYVVPAALGVLLFALALSVDTAYPSNANAHAPEECKPLAEEAKKRHGEVNGVFDSYVQLRQNPRSDNYALEVLEAADYTIDEVTKTLNNWLEVLVCVDVLSIHY